MSPALRLAALVAEVAQRRGANLGTPEEIAASPECQAVVRELAFWSLVTARTGDVDLSDAVRVLVVRIGELRDERLAPFVVGRIAGGVVTLEAAP